MRRELVMDPSRPAPSPMAIPSLILLLTLAFGACTSETPGETTQAVAKDGSWSVTIPRNWSPLDKATLDRKPRGSQNIEAGWLVEKFTESDRAVFLVWRGVGQDLFPPTVVPSKEEVQEQFGPEKKVIDFAVRDIGGRSYWRIVTQIHTESDGRTTRQVMYRTWDADDTYAFQFIAPPDRFDQRLPLFERVAASIRVEDRYARLARRALWIIGIAGTCLLAGAALLVAWLVRRGRKVSPMTDSHSAA